MKFLIFSVAFVGLLLLFVSHASADGCKISLKSMPLAEPVILIKSASQSKFELFKPTGEITNYAVNTKFQLLCAGNNNAIQLLEQPSLELICRSGNILETTDTGVSYELHQLGCKSIPTADLRLSSTKCSHDRGYIFEAGFNYNTHDFASVFSICYDNVTENTFYTHNTLNGAAISFSISESTRRAFRANGMKFTTTATNNYYTINSQISRFETYFGESQSYVSSAMYMARGHLTPDADFIMRYEQLATYFYANVAPEYQVVNAGNWLRVENLARTLAALYADDLEIYNGYMGQLELPHPETGALVAIHLDAGQQIEAPQYYFKVIKHAATDAAVVMITLNNPFYTVPVDELEFCSNICAEAGLTNDIFADTTRGYTFCCALSDFKQYYVHLPDELKASRLLKSSNDVPTGDSDDAEIVPDTNESVEESGGCLITMPTDIPRNEPVYILTTVDNATPRLLKPTGEFTTLPVGSNLTLYCAGGSGNYLADLQQDKLVLSCQQDNTFYSFEKLKTYSLSQLGCTRIPTPDMQLTAQRCANGKGYLFKPGFWLGKQFVDAFAICYDNVTEHTYYARNVINGATQSFKIIDSTRRAFRADGMKFTTTATNNFYTINGQKSRFETYFGAQQTYINNSMFLARGHLTPDADFIFAYESMTTYYYANVAPEFQIVNAVNWLRVESIARNLANEFQSDLLTYTSTLGQLELPNDSGELVSIYLDNGHFIEAPKWYYKILMHAELETDLVLITLNNPFAKAADIVEFCPNVCDTYGIGSPHFGDISRGYTFCCTLEEFRKAVPDLPAFDLPDDWEF